MRITDEGTVQLARAMYPTLERSLRVNRGFALPVSGDSMDAVIRALGEGVARVEVGAVSGIRASGLPVTVEKWPDLPEPIDRGPLPDVAESDWAAFTEEQLQQADLDYLRGQDARDARRLAETVQAEAQLDAMRKGAAI